MTVVNLTCNVTTAEDKAENYITVNQSELGTKTCHHVTF